MAAEDFSLPVIYIFRKNWFCACSFLILLPLGATVATRALVCLGGTLELPPSWQKAVPLLTEVGMKSVAVFIDGWISPAAAVVVLD